ncbi:hypothetical protein CDL12_30234 [Handroanthus impetiginosus]|uniref:DUF7054 domain-containing protein n=1 Tax=Handroanthus impetiginosus TaxID=429701 RepID=A0A2G9FW55_9LAMI|nr:hypothetical protein CDL12_30234 [Handroanthus impetiginosus]
MSKRDLKRRNIPSNRRPTSSTRSRRPPPSPSPAIRWTIKPEANFLTPSKSTKGLKRSKSEPSLWKADGAREIAAEAEEEEVLYRPWTCTDLFASPEVLTSQSPLRCSQWYSKDAKVVVSVTVEGSPGPIRTMVKLGSNVEEVIKHVIDKYNDEGRTPHLDKDAASTCELHHSYFSLESLNKSEVLGDVGSRSFYLRKSSSRTADVSAPSNLVVASPQPFLASLIDRKIKKIVRRIQKFWKILGCSG